MNVDKLKEFVYEGQITWTMTTIGYVKYTLNLVTWLVKSKVPWKLCVICCDPQSEAFFRREKVPCVLWKEEGVGRRTQDGMAAFSTPSFSICNRDKILLLHWFAENYGLIGTTKSLYLDGDIVVQKDPWPLLDTVLKEIPQSEANLAFQCDCFNALDHGGGLICEGCNSPCSGVILTRHVSPSQANIYEWEKDLWVKCDSMDQPYITKMMELTGTKYKILGRRQFGNGMWQKSGVWKDGDWTLLHYNYLVSGSKRTHMKNAEHWLINM
jgi:hypothetical protein